MTNRLNLHLPSPAAIRKLPMPESMETHSLSKPKGLASAQAAKILEHVNYQDGAVVSREIVKKPTGTVTIFAFDDGQGLSEHTAPFDAVVQVVDGDAEITISGQLHRVQGGEMILMPAGKPHALKALTRFKMILTMIRS
jgi:quercetin dioxygenase-like cupin family protein